MNFVSSNWRHIFKLFLVNASRNLWFKVNSWTMLLFWLNFLNWFNIRPWSWSIKGHILFHKSLFITSKWSNISFLNLFYKLFFERLFCIILARSWTYFHLIVSVKSSIRRQKWRSSNFYSWINILISFLLGVNLCQII